MRQLQSPVGTAFHRRPRLHSSVGTAFHRRPQEYAENGIICTLNMSGEMHMVRRRDARMRYSAAYPTGAERRLMQQIGIVSRQ